MNNKEYQGWRAVDGSAYIIVYTRGPNGVNERLLEQPIYHSPDGFEWGYGGSGPSDAALAILLDAFDEMVSLPKECFDRYGYMSGLRAIEATSAYRIHHQFKDKQIARLGRRERVGTDHDRALMEWAMGEDFVLSEAAMIEHDMGIEEQVDWAVSGDGTDQ